MARKTSISAAPSRALAESSPYYEGLKKNYEVLFCYDPYDELVLMQLQTFLGKNIISVAKEMRLDRNTERDQYHNSKVSAPRLSTNEG